MVWQVVIVDDGDAHRRNWWLTRWRVVIDLKLNYPWMLSYLASPVKTNGIAHLIGLWGWGRDKPIVWWESVYITRPPPPTQPKPTEERTTFSSDFVLPDNWLPSAKNTQHFIYLVFAWVRPMWSGVTRGLNIETVKLKFFTHFLHHRPLIFERWFGEDSFKDIQKDGFTAPPK